MADQNSEFPEATSPRARRTTRRVRRTEEEPVALADRQADPLDSGRKPAVEAEAETPAPRKRRPRVARTTEETAAEPARNTRTTRERAAVDPDSSFGEGLLDEVPAAPPARRPRRDAAVRRASTASETEAAPASEYTRNEPTRSPVRDNVRDEVTERESTPRRPSRGNAREESARPADDSRARDWFEHESLDFDSGSTPRSTRSHEPAEPVDQTRNESRPQTSNTGEESGDFGTEGEGLRRRRRRRRGNERPSDRSGQFDQPQFASSEQYFTESQPDSDRPDADSNEGGHRTEGPRGPASRNDAGRQEGYRTEGGRSDAFRQDVGRQDAPRNDSPRTDNSRNEGVFDRSDSDGGRRRRRRRRRGRGGEGGVPQQGSAPQGGRRGHDNQQNSRHRNNRDQRGGRGPFQNQPQHRNDRNRGRGPQQYDNDLSGEITGTIEGVLEIHPTKGFGFLRDPKKNYLAQDSDAFVSSSLIERYRLREGVLITGGGGPGSRGQGPRLKAIEKIDGRTPEEYQNIKSFDDLTPINPFEQIRLETGPKPVTMRVMDLLTPIGKGQRALIVAPPRSGKTMLLQDIADAVSQNHPELHLMVVLIDERPEEVTEMRRRVRGDVIASSMDRDVENHIRVSQLIFERAKRLVEAGGEVFILLDSVTRLARAFNKGVNTGRTGTGGLDVRALDIPRKIFGTARRFDEGGSLTVVATALIDTGSRMDDSIFQEFKGTGNMELVLSRDLADRRIWPAMDISMSGTRREEKILSKEVLDGVTLLRRSLVSMNPTEAMEQLIRTLERFPSNKEFLARIRNVL